MKNNDWNDFTEELKEMGGMLYLGFLIGKKNNFNKTMFENYLVKNGYVKTRMEAKERAYFAALALEEPLAFSGTGDEIYLAHYAVKDALRDPSD